MKLSPDVERVAIAKIVVGVRRRQKLGNLRSLARSIEARGLLHPILLRNGHELVAGQRRLEACKSLGWTTIPARRVDGLSDEELRAVELEENTERLPLLDYEASRARLAELRQSAADAHARNNGNTVAIIRRGQPSKPGSDRALAKEAGTSHTAVQKLESYVTVAEQYPVFQRPEWRQHHVLEAAEKLAKLPEADRPKVAALLDQPALPPKTGLELIDNLTAMTPAARRDVFRLAESDDPHDRRIANSKAAAVPPPPDPGLVLLLDADDTLRRAAKVCREEKFKGEVAALADDATTLAKAFKAHVEATR